MDLGIKGRRALVCASSKGLGRGCAEALAAEGVDLVLNSRGADALEATADAIRAAIALTSSLWPLISPPRQVRQKCWPPRGRSIFW